MEKYFEITENGKNIKCKMYYKNENEVKDVIISCHGFGGSKDNNFSKKLSEVLLSKFDDKCIITFDWPCHGDDVRKNLNLKDCNDYLSLIIKFVEEKYNTQNLYLNATSFGGYLSLKYIYENGNPFKKISLRCPAINMGKVLYYNVLKEQDRLTLEKGKSVYTGYEKLVKITPQFIDELYAKDISNIDFETYSNNIIIIHGVNDELVSFDTVKIFSEANNIPLYPINDCGHIFNDPAKAREAIDDISDYLFSSINDIKVL